MNIQELITEGHNRKVSAEQAEHEESIRRMEKAQEAHVLSWQPILQRVTECLPPELAHALITPEHSASQRDGGISCAAPFTIHVPRTAIRIRCNPETRWRMGDTPVFRPMQPKAFLDDEKNRYFVDWEEYGYWMDDFLIVLAEAAELAEQLPAVIEECQTRNDNRLAKEDEPTPAQEVPNRLADAIQILDAIDEDNDYQNHDMFIRLAQTNALIDIAQQLRRLNGLA